MRTDDYIRPLQKTWTPDKHSRQWPRTINDYVDPVSGDMSITEVDTGQAIHRIVRPSTAFKRGGESDRLQQKSAG